MPETRTYDPTEGNPIAQALRAAMGEPVRPTTPGTSKATPDSPAEAAPASTSWVSLSFPPAPAPAPDED